MWYKNAVIYNLDVETFADSNGDGIGDFQGLIDRLDHLENLGITCVWLQPFQPSPNHDDGYDITDYYGVDPRLGTLGDFAAFVHELKERGIRLLLDLVVNHTSDQHPWFLEACRNPASPYRDYYIWSDTLPPDADQGVVFPGVQKSIWTLNETAGAYYYHRFYDHQPDLNISNPAVRAEILKIIGYWLALGVSGFRIDAAPFLIEVTGQDREQAQAMYGFLREIHDFMGWRCGDAVLLAEANVEREKIADYFGDGDRMHMLFNFIVNQAMFLAFARERAEPLVEALGSLPNLRDQGHWAQFLRGHDELDLGRLTEHQRQEVFRAFAPKATMQLYGRGIRRRLATMFEGDLRRVEMAHSLMFSLPGTQVIRYGDEIGMGDDLSLSERLAVRTPMQWSAAPNAGFSTAAPEQLIRQVIGRGPFAYERLNVEAQIYDRDSLLNRMQRLIRARRSCPEIGKGDTVVVEAAQPEVFAHICRNRTGEVLALHNLSSRRLQVRLQQPVQGRPVDLVGDQSYPPAGDAFALGPYGYRWLRIERAR